MCLVQCLTRGTIVSIAISPAYIKQQTFIEPNVVLSIVLCSTPGVSLGLACGAWSTCSLSGF